MRTTATAIAILATLSSVSLAAGLLVGSSLRAPKLGEVTCLGNEISVKNINFHNTGYTQADAADLYAAMAAAVCSRRFRTIRFVGGVT
jgi:hypothetical protein